MGNTAGNQDQNTSCSIVGLKGILIQASLGVLSFSVLIIKRLFFQNPKRPWKIWRFDTAKQGISQLLAHFINLTISLALTQQDPNSDTCLWYFITNVFDNTAGVLICVLSLRMIEKLLFNKKKYTLISGNYYQIKQQAHRQQLQQHPQNQPEERQELSTQKIIISYKSWLIQLAIWNSIVIFSKFLLFILEFFLTNVLDELSKFLLGWIQAYPNLQLVVVIVIVPVIMNGFAFWVQDNFLKKRQIPIDVETQSIQIQLQPNQQVYKQQNTNPDQSINKDISVQNQNEIKQQKFKLEGQTMDAQMISKSQVKKQEYVSPIIQ